MSGPIPDGLRTDQAPPLAIPASFFLLGPAAMIVTGGLLMWSGMGVLASRWLPLAFAATHVGTLGFLGSIMIGALYQMIPVVAGAPVPAARLAHFVQLAWTGAVSLLVFGLVTGRADLLRMAVYLIGAALLTFLIPTALGMVRAHARTSTIAGMRVALGGLLAVAAVGAAMAWARATGTLVLRGDWIAWLASHATLGGLVWVGGLITAVSWQVIPMFYVTAPFPRWSRVATPLTLALALVAALLVPPLGGTDRHVALGAAPAAVMVWLVHPVLAILALRRRKRRRREASVEAWVLGLAMAPLVFVSAAATALGQDGRYAVALGWLGIWGWAALIAHGMLCRIVPFLVWFHRFSRFAGLQPIPSMRELLPDGRVRTGVVLHGGAVLCGGIAIAWGSDLAARGGGGLLAASGLTLAANLIGALRRRAIA